MHTSRSTRCERKSKDSGDFHVCSEREFNRTTTKCEREKRQKKDQANRKVCMSSITVSSTTTAAAVATIAGKSRSHRRHRRHRCLFVYRVYDFEIGENKQARTNACAEHVQINLVRIHRYMLTHTHTAASYAICCK